MSPSRPTHRHTTTSQQVLSLYWWVSQPYRLALFTLFATIGLGQVMATIIPLYYKRFFDQLAAALPTTAKVDQLTQIILAILGLNIINLLLFRVGTFVNNYFQGRMIRDLKRSSFAYLLGHSYAFFSNNFAGALVQRVNRLAKAFERFADRLLWDVWTLIIRMGGILISLYFVNQRIAGAVLVWAIAFMLMHYFSSLWKLKYDLRRSALDSEVTAVLADAISNHTTIQTFSGVTHETAGFEDVTQRHYGAMKLSWDIGSVIESVQVAMVVSVEFFVFYYGIRFWQVGLISIGSFVLIQTYILDLSRHLWNVGRTIRDIYESFADAREMVDILRTSHGVPDQRAAQPLVVAKGKVAFRKIEFRYHTARPILKNVSLTIDAGQKVALIGPSGAGKSTIVKLLFRFYDTTSGTITIDGQDIRTVTQTSLRDQVSLVPQDPILFHRTLMENIRYGRRDATDDEVRAAARLAHCDEFIQALPQNYETYVGERGIKLSGGERQRVAIARAILKNAPILVLDEATSSLDSESELLIQDALETLMRGKTTIVIAHRLSTIRKMDRIIVLDQGQIVEDGSHAQLLRKKTSLYRKLWHLQAGGFIADTN